MTPDDNNKNWSQALACPPFINTVSRNEFAIEVLLFVRSDVRFDVDPTLIYPNPAPIRSAIVIVDIFPLKAKVKTCDATKGRAKLQIA